MKTVISFFATIFFSANAFTQSSAEVMCRGQAKEAAVKAYSSCITENNNKVQEIIKNYKQELKDVKAKYDGRLKNLHTNPNKLPSASKPPKGVVKDLPPAQLQSVTEGPKVVAVGNQEPTEALEQEASTADQPEFIEMPVE